MAVAAYKAKIRILGTPTAANGLATTADSTNLIFTISDVNKRVLDSSVTPVVHLDGIVVDPNTYSINYLYGYITFLASQAPGSVVTIDATYIPSSDIIGASSYSLNVTAEILDTTSFTNDGFRTKIYGIIDVSVSVSRYFTINAGYKQRMLNRERVLIDLVDRGRGWFVIESDNQSGDIASLETEELSFQGDNVTGSSFQWS